MNQELYQITVGAVLKWNRLFREITLSKASELKKILFLLLFYLVSCLV